MSLINVGTKAPGFVLSDQHGEKVNLEDLRGRKVILSLMKRGLSDGRRSIR
jgi:peroxiredoxin